ncbi:MAG TPA: preprotein translocase subunit SecA [Candidatus Paceibacterota bacterium]|nr:preprotein translocase subunit SecA [Candidatus Paceibacterota bacterium]
MLFNFSKNPSQGYLSSKRKTLDRINQLEKEIENLKSEEFPEKINQLRLKVKEKQDLDKILEEVFALTREASRRTLKQRHYDVQILGGIALHEGKVIEMKTGEGKTLAATLPVTLNALLNKGVHIITVNDYLAKRDAVWMGQIYNYLGLSVACITQEGAFLYDPNYKLSQEEKDQLDQKRDELGSFKVVKEFLRPINRKEAYLADILYGTNSEFGFDYLRDNLVYDLEEKVQRGHYFAIIDEVDSVLIDEARTPLIISSPDEEAGKLYQEFSRIASRLEKGEDFILDEKEKAVTLTEEGLNKLEKIFGFNIFNEKGVLYVHHLENALKARYLFLKDRDYIVKDGRVIIVDEFTGRLLPDRRYSGGLHQAIEAKERVAVKEESRTVATITLQNYFRMYEKISGMTGTAWTSQEEFKKVYNLEVVVIPTNKPMIRKDLPDRIYKNSESKLKAVVKEVKTRYEKGQPVLVGTPSVEKNEILSQYLKKANVSHNVLNAKNHEREGEIIAQAGKLKAVTVATNMAGRGVDIILGGNPPDEEERKKIIELGGLHIIGTERHEARRIDNQLRGRAGRQGDPGSSQFFLSLEDDLVRIFAPKYLFNLIEKLGWPEDEPIEHKMVSKAIEMAQTKIENYYFDARKHVLEYDNVINKQRLAFYRQRDNILSLAEEKKMIDFIKEVFKRNNEKLNEESLEKRIKELQEEKINDIFKVMALQILDLLWVNHLERMESLRDSTALRAYGGKDPLVEYKKESYFFYQDLEKKFEEILINNVKNVVGGN